MKRLFLFLLLAALASAHAEDAAETVACSAPVLSELTISFWQFAVLAGLVLAGALCVGYGVATKKWAFALAGIVLAAAASGFYLQTPGFNPATGFFEKNQHVHADFKVYVNGGAVNFSEGRFQSTNEHSLTEYVHFHDGNGNVVHLHASGVPLSYIFGTFGGFLNQTCIRVAQGEPLYCAEEGTLKLGPNRLKFFVNNQSVTDLSPYPFHDLDQILISFGPVGADVSGELASVTSEACIPSGKCPVPEGYDLHNESCGS